MTDHAIFGPSVGRACAYAASVLTRRQLVVLVQGPAAVHLRAERRMGGGLWVIFSRERRVGA